MSNNLLLLLRIAGVALSICAGGCVARVPAEEKHEPGEHIVEPSRTPDATFTMNAPERIVEIIHDILGDNGALQLNTKQHKLTHDDLTVTLPDETHANYELTPDGGTITFEKPEPIVTAKLFAGIKVSPSLEKIVLNADDTATAHVRSLFGTHKRTFPLGWETEAETTAALSELPVVFAYSFEGCKPCEDAKRAFSSATDIPFRVEWKKEVPAWVVSYPTFHWQVAGDEWRYRDRWDGLEKFVEMWKASRK